MTALLPLALSLALGSASVEAAAPASALPERADLVEVHLGAGTPGIRLVCKPPASAGPDAEPYVVEVMVPDWPTLQDAAPSQPSLADEPIAVAPVFLSAPTTLASAVPTASYATQPIEPSQPIPTDETAFLRHAPADELEPPTAPEAPPMGTASAAPVPPPAPVQKELTPPPEWLSAAENFEKACDGGYAEACTALADMVASGQAGDPDIPRARDLYERGCDKGDDAACAAIAPIDVPPPAAAPMVQNVAPKATAVIDAAPQVLDQAPAATQAPAFAVERDLFDACQRGENAACNELGERHSHGDGVSHDYERAAKLFQRACAGGELAACTNLGILYKVGEGVSLDELRAERLFALACNGGAGDDRACGLAGE